MGTYYHLSCGQCRQYLHLGKSSARITKISCKVCILKNQYMD